MKLCAICCKTVRVRVSVYVFGNDGLRRALACNGCARQSIRLVPTSPASRCSCGEAATICGRCVDRRMRAPDATRKKIALKLRRLARAYERAPDESEQEHIDGRVAGLEQAAGIVEGYDEHDAKPRSDR